ncbi:unnamed protein product [Rotaria sp. Silwood1]|nr:unnamed protein product [Rotaria sp. Silwood1]CAF4935399.1 unnamed protein product [Rotaria sp. Silwood1]
MAKRDVISATFEQVDTNRDGKIDRNELRNFVSNTEESRPAPCESSIIERNFNDNTTGRFDRNIQKYPADKYTPYGTTTFVRDAIDDTVINTNSSEETNRYIERSPGNIYKDPNPQIIRRAAPERPVTYEQRIHLKYLQPPAVPAPGPLIIREVRPPQPPLPPPLIIHEQSTSACVPPPLYLRERPPIRPPCIRSETTTKYLPAIPLPPRSVIIERYPPLPEKPRDIYIERWLPYGPPPERRTIVEPAPPPIPYPEPRNKIITYDAVEARTVRKLEHLGLCNKDPADYVARYGDSLLDSETLVQRARNAGVIEDLSPPVGLSSGYTQRRVNTAFDQSNEIINRGSSSYGGFCCDDCREEAGAPAIIRENTSYASSSKFSRDSKTKYGVYDDDACLTATDANRDGKTKETEHQQYI